MIFVVQATVFRILALHTVPPRAQYFVVVGGLVCCKDDLGCAR